MAVGQCRARVGTSPGDSRGPTGTRMIRWNESTARNYEDVGVFTADPDALWRRILERKGPPWARLARIPFDPSMN